MALDSPRFVSSVDTCTVRDNEEGTGVDTLSGTDGCVCTVNGDGLSWGANMFAVAGDGAGGGNGRNALDTDADVGEL